LPACGAEGGGGGGCRGSRAREEGSARAADPDSGALSLHVRATSSLANALDGDEKWGIYEKSLIMRIWLGPGLNRHRSRWLAELRWQRTPAAVSAASTPPPPRPPRHRFVPWTRTHARFPTPLLKSLRPTAGWRMAARWGQCHGNGPFPGETCCRPPLLVPGAPFEELSGP